MVRVLLTGFGPFPGVPDNPSGRLVPSLLEVLGGAVNGQDYELHGAVLPTEWETMAARIRHLHDAHRPHLMVHFGAHPRAKGLRLERAAHNRLDPRLDACGARPKSSFVSERGRERLETALSVTAMAAGLRRHGHAARVSNSCGRYLCNGLYYRSLAWTEAQGGDAVFVHVPLTRAQGGHCEEQALLRASEATVHLALDAMQAARARTGTGSFAVKTQEGLSV